MTIITIDKGNAKRKCNFILRNNGSIIKRLSDGITSQNTLFDREDILFTSRVSTYNHINARIETSGTEARIPPHNELRLLISDIEAINTAEIIILKM